MSKSKFTEEFKRDAVRQITKRAIFWRRGFHSPMLSLMIA